MNDIKKLNKTWKTKIVTIYGDPLTRINHEGLARIAEIISVDCEYDGKTLCRAKVRFCDYPADTYERTLLL